MNEALAYLFGALIVICINLVFKDGQNRRNHKNIYPEIVKYDSTTMVRIDSLITVYK